MVVFSCSVFIWFLYQDDVALIEWLWDYSFLFSLLEEFEKYKFFFVRLVDASSEIIQFWAFVCREGFLVLFVCF